MTRAWTPAALLMAPALLALTACGRDAADQDARPVAQVTTAVVGAGQAEDSLTAYGAAEYAPGALRTLTAPVDASLSRIVVPAGAPVAAGAVVAILAPAPGAALDLARARTDAAAADAARERTQRLRAAGLAGDGEVETARAQAQTADELLASLNARAGGGLSLRAPMAGVVDSYALETGAVAAQGAPVVKIAAAGAGRVKLGLEPGQAARVRPGMLVRLGALAGEGPAREARIAAVDPRLDPLTRQAAVYADAPAGGFAPGQPVVGHIVLAARGGAMLAPRGAVVWDGDRPVVFIAAGGHAHRREVVLGAAQGDEVEVVRGLAAGERIAVDGASALEDGMALREAPPARAAADDGP